MQTLVNAYEMDTTRRIRVNTVFFFESVFFRLRFFLSSGLFLCVAEIQRRQMFKIHVVVLARYLSLHTPALQNRLKNIRSALMSIHECINTSFLSPLWFSIRSNKKMAVNIVCSLCASRIHIFSPNKELPHATYGRRMKQKITKTTTKNVNGVCAAFMWFPLNSVPKLSVKWRKVREHKASGVDFIRFKNWKSCLPVATIDDT